MYIFKQPNIGGEVTCHQDSTFLYTEPIDIVGLWFALEDATVENGCLWAIPGGHRHGLKSRWVRAPEDKMRFEIFDAEPWPEDQLVPLEVSKGSLILLHGLLPHRSFENRSTRSRHAYTLHLIGGKCEVSGRQLVADEARHSRLFSFSAQRHKAKFDAKNEPLNSNFFVIFAPFCG